MVNCAPDAEAIFSALANSTRRRILERLRGRPRTITDLADPFDISLVAVSRHVHRLEEAGLVTLRKEGRSRICRLEPEALRPVDGWLHQFRTFWEDELEQIGRYLEGTGEEAT